MSAVRIETLDWADDTLVRQARALIVAAFDDGGAIHARDYESILENALTIMRPGNRPGR